ncbi:hypothetical protein [Pelagicoccus sp. SDUM812005]|uniref:hypothetical protein n=1 Tax=Pelagicoccus sp. SDUM812005 TaxID=3041257 RepID=UPI00280F4722|nr:hypothetical protein [Pelagicoccus sp. SDUM812005]MDQ8183707.1 hypothetical protein [Pelagicoccus sp. SDUM812005]
MKYSLLLHPLIVFFGVSTFALLNWFLTPFDLFARWGVVHLADRVLLLGIWAVTGMSFVIGTIAALVVFQGEGRVASLDVRRLDQVYWVSVGLSVFSFAFFVLNAIVRGGVGALLDPYTSREYYVTGITTWVHFGTATVVLCLLLKSVGLCTPWKIVGGVVVLGTLAFRSVLGAERLALFVPLLGGLVAWMVLRQIRFRLWHAIAVPLVPVLFFGAFAAMEYGRSYKSRIKDGHIEAGLLSYSFERIQLYYALSVNSGGLLYELVEDTGESYPVFGGTVGPLSDITRRLFPPGIYLPGEKPITKDVGREMAEGGMYNPEFNNKWGLVTPYLEGRIVGFFYWMIAGFVGAAIHRSAMRSQSIFSIAALGVFIAGLVDAASRVNLLAGSQILFPLVLLLLAKVLVERKETLAY